MPVTEVALCRLSPGITIENPELRSKLAHAKTVMQNYTGRRFHLLQHIHDPSDVFIIGEWDSLDQHMNDFIPGQANQEIVKGLEHLMTVEWLLHIDASQADLPFPKTDAEQHKAVQEGAVISVMRYSVRAGQREKFQEETEINFRILEGFITGGTAGSGWRIDKWLDKEEWLLFMPWKNQEQQEEFLRWENVSKFAPPGGCMYGVEIKHAIILDI